MSSRIISSCVTIEPAPTAKRRNLAKILCKAKRAQKLREKRGGHFGALHNTAILAPISQATTNIANAVIFEVEVQELKKPEVPEIVSLFTPGCAGCQGVGFKHHSTSCMHHGC